jgi:hypothetical protein
MQLRGSLQRPHQQPHKKKWRIVVAMIGDSYRSLGVCVAAACHWERPPATKLRTPVPPGPGREKEWLGGKKNKRDLLASFNS